MFQAVVAMAQGLLLKQLLVVQPMVLQVLAVVQACMPHMLHALMHLHTTLSAEALSAA